VPVEAAILYDFEHNAPWANHDEQLRRAGV